MRPSAMTMGRTTGTAMRCPSVLALYFVFMGLLYPILAQELQVTPSSPVHKSEVGTSTNISCTVNLETAKFSWKFNGKEIESDERLNITQETKKSTLIISNISAKDAGNYTCKAALGEVTASKVIFLDPSFKGKAYLKAIFDPSFNTDNFIKQDNDTFKVNMNSHNPVNITIECIFEVYEPKEVKWYHFTKIRRTDLHPEPIGKNSRQLISKEVVTLSSAKDNGTYACEMEDSVTDSTITANINLLYCTTPKVILEPPIPIGKSKVFLNWTVIRNNEEIKEYHLSYGIKNSTDRQFSSHIIHLNKTYFVLEGLINSTEYEVQLNFKSDFQNLTHSNIVSFMTLPEDPTFIPQITINGFSATSVTIGWETPKENLLKYIHYYKLTATNKNNKTLKLEAIHPQGPSYLPYMFDNLEPHSTYIFEVSACFDYGGEICGLSSDKMEAATLDGVPSEPIDVTVECGIYNMSLKWSPPTKPNAEIKGYTLELTGNATFRDRFGNTTYTTWGPLSKFTKNDSFDARFDDLQPYTQYTVKLSAMTRTRRRGEEVSRNCTTKHAPPDHPPRPRWRKIVENDKFMFKIYLPRLSERNGPICCYRVYMVRLLPQTDWSKSLNSPKDLPVIEYRDAHAQSPQLGAYITDIFTNDNYPPESELVLGDNKSHYDKRILKPQCEPCLKKYSKEKKPIVTTPATIPTTTSTSVPDEVNTEDIMDEEEEAEPDARKRRSNDNIPYKTDVGPLVDGPLDPTANYTLFVEIISDPPAEESLFTNYMNPLMPAATPVAPRPSTPVEIALQATCAVAALVLLLMLVFCVRQTRRSRKMPPHAHLELNPLQVACRYLFPGLGGRQHMVPTAPPDMAPIAKEDLAAAYAERQADSDYGFQKEFELLQMLPECYSDRTTHASEARENQPKNRYPDIKAYDQTRVKLSQIDSINGSDYINANYVMGYQERKRFICAQGPTDTTVNDFWRMIWEQGLELIVMLTNLEEYSKVKCSKYWPDADRGARAFGGITVYHVSEKRYSDYIVRELRITKQPLSADGQPIVENNGVSKRNGDCKEAAEGSVPTSPREVKDTESRIVKQYHFLMWKDFAAPEHAYSILKFIKRVNEAWASMVSRVCVVHCSAGVGRTGTLVALDCLLQQLHAHHHAAVFNTVAELRRQRNFLVQSLKQYVFVYRALVEFAHYGDTEIPACRLKNSIDKLRNTPPGAANCLMEIEFEKILNSPIPEPLKSCAAGAAEELRSKNRSQEILPYDRNRVILAPIPTRDFSTYINASFIEAYDNSEGFIITQDPLPTTIMDFWRMVSEHNVSTIVMLSELGEGKCPRYWDDGSAQYEHISVQYEESESCPYYTRRQFRAVNTKSGAAVCVRQLQYQGWPTAVGAVPEVTRGLAELADAAAPPPAAPPSAMLVHCHLGTERSSLFVALCILICQLRTERRVDVCCVARKVRSQRANTIDTFLHYEFLHRAILNYAELHNLLEDS